MNLLLTGATGFVGRNYLLRALDRGWKVATPVRNEQKLVQQLEKEGVSRGDVQVLSCDTALWPAGRRWDAVVHCAGALFERDLKTYLATNLGWTAAVLEKVPERCPVIILSSQSAGGPTPASKERRSERDPDEPVSDYGESKLRMERWIRRSGRRHFVILRPPMILGPRDSAALQLFQMAGGAIRTKPGWTKKIYSFIASSDLLDAVDATLASPEALWGRSHYVASMQRFTDHQLLNQTAACLGARGINLPLPQALVRSVSLVVDATPALREKLPSLTRDRVREILEDRWVVDPTRFMEATGWTARKTLAETLKETHAYYRATGRLS